MADLFELSGSYTTTPATGSPSAAPTIGAPIDEAVSLKAKHVDDVSLTVDSPVSLAFGGVANAHVVILRSSIGYVRARVTYADGSQQAVPVDPLCVILALNKPIAAIDLTRSPATSTVVSVFLGEKQ